MWVVASTSLSVMMQSMWVAACMALLGMKQSTGWRKIRMVLELKGDNFKIWKERILLQLGCMDIDYAIRKDEPHKITDTSTPDEILLYECWEKSNCLNLMYIKTKINADIHGSIEQHENVRDFLKVIDEQFVTSDKALASTLIMFTSLKLTSVRGVREHIMEMMDILNQLKKLEVEMSKSFLVHFILNTLPPQYGPFKISYNTHKDKWSINELMTMCVQEEGRLLMEQGESVMLVTQKKGKSQAMQKPLVVNGFFKTKKDSLGNIERYKARLVAKGFTQKERIDYTETFSPISKKDSLHIILALVAHFDLELQQIDVKTTFLNRELEEEVYMKQPEGFPSNDENVMDQCIYLKVSGSRVCFLVLYMNDILLVTNDKGLLHEVKQFLSKNFDMKDMGETSYVIAIKIHRDRFQVKDNMFNLNQCPKNDIEREQMKNIPYASVVGSLMYAQVCTRLDIAIVVGMLGRYRSNPSLDHWKAAKKVMRYLQGTKDYKLMYRWTSNLKVVGYLDSDFAGCVDSRKSTSGSILY
ncbi:Retrovirus-related Pol polyprotein from transposon TNT 1-94 [Vitis vinifera]|uniref:Retrovirus-related Pol polyprotein from transposon TNT 1-94 n=1 Tax=Vitis vinifera TaxID=29760 RepID=A0A438E761_VITVI|nr:Retrovirus-related Pol polyprotein from transposon TNT 1-94 [Vitis vinifera]